MDNLTHFSVMLNECLDGLNLKANGVYFDGTLGGAGHSYQILKRTSPTGRLVATDLDDYAIGRAKETLKEFDGRFTLVKDNFKNFLEVKNNLGIDEFGKSGKASAVIESFGFDANSTYEIIKNIVE